jgi:hypothetical protein
LNPACEYGIIERSKEPHTTTYMGLAYEQT